ncbi:MAG TPA: hypothetical protein VHV51_23015 [Polyangiaceae bacterium]|jgi:hypothetical protein|nr:hypothetical protein [Polyangiaceae bacterium]
MFRTVWSRSGVLFGCLCLSATANAQDRPSDADIFGAAPAPSPPAAPAPPNGTPGTAPVTPVPSSTAPAPVAAPPAPPAAAAEAQAPNASPSPSRDAQILGSGETPMFNEEAAPEDPLKIGGQLYLRAQTTASTGQGPSAWAFSSPSLLDVYLDARPNDRVRGFVLGRMVFDPTLPASASQSESIAAVSATGSTSGSANLSSLFQQQTRAPVVSLDQLWINFDVAHTVFVTAGKQHVRWGTGHFWAPTDFLHLRPRNPLDVFDARTGTTMVKLQLPIESRAWNFYGYVLTENSVATPTLGDVAAAGRAEFVLGPSELGLGVLGQRDHKAKLAADLSFGIGDFDFYGELGLRSGGEIDRVSYNAAATAPPPYVAPSWQAPSDAALSALEQTVDAYYPVYRSNGYKAQAVGGLSYSRKYNDNDLFTVGAEYFYNGLGYASPAAYPGLVLPHTIGLNDSANFFYLGQHYAALYVTFPAPYTLDNHTFTLSTLGNLSDRSFITRLDYSLIALTHVRFEAFASARYGNENGEFRFGVSNLNLGGVNFSRAPALMDFGLALRIAI